jgi:pyridoxal phosphate enzyme (YggS family)
MTLEKKLKTLLDQIDQAASAAGRKASEIKFVAISKGRGVEEIKEAYSLGIKDFGENRLDEAFKKMDRLPEDIRWHFVGKLQRNKVKKVIGKFALIHSVDTVELAHKISWASIEQGVTTPVLLEANTSGEKAKSGLAPAEWKEKFIELLELKGINIQGLMTMAPLTEEEMVIRACFSKLHQLQQELEQKGGNLAILSMGMSHDFPIAIQEGATLIRIGTAFFISQ